MCSFKKKVVGITLCTVLLAVILMAAEVIQTQESDKWDGLEANLTSLTIKNNILTIKLKIHNTSDAKQEPGIYFQDCYIMDETNQKKYFALKDTDGKYIAGPVRYNRSGGYFQEAIQPSKSKGVWMKFPEPADKPESVTIYIPGFFPFEEVALSK